MQDNHVLRNPKYLFIGDFLIVFQKLNTDIQMEIPYSGMAYSSLNKQKIDFQFLLAESDINDSGELLWGSTEFSIPTLIYRRSNGEFDWITLKNDLSPRISFHINADWSQFCLFQDNTESNGERAFHEFSSLFSYAILNHYACVFHGVIMEYKGMGILVIAPAGTGKTTHTRMWRDFKNALILNGDRCLCRKVDDIWYAYGMPWSGSSGEHINRRVPISCFVNLNRGSKNEVHLLSSFDGCIRLMERIFAPAWPGELQNSAFNYCDEIAEKIPILDFYCKPDLESVETLEKEILKVCKK